MTDLLESELLANLVLFFAFGATALGSLMMVAGLAMQRRQARQRA